MAFKKKSEKAVSPEVAGIHQMQKEYGLGIAAIFDNNDWAISKAREIDLDKEPHLAGDVDRVMRRMRDLYKFVGVSANNIYWNLT